jgi:hypothetical protein
MSDQNASPPSSESAPTSSDASDSPRNPEAELGQPAAEPERIGGIHDYRHGLSDVGPVSRDEEPGMIVPGEYAAGMVGALSGDRQRVDEQLVHAELDTLIVHYQRLADVALAKGGAGDAIAAGGAVEGLQRLRVRLFDGELDVAKVFERAGEMGGEGDVMMSGFESRSTR